MPLPPSTLTLKNRTDDSLTVSWVYDMERSYVTGWMVQITEKGRDNWRDVSNLPVTTLEQTINNVESGANYVIRIFAISYDNTRSTASASVDATVGE